VPSIVRFLVILITALKLIVPLQLNLMVSPAAALLIVVRKVASLQVATVSIAAKAVGVVPPLCQNKPATPAKSSSPSIVINLNLLAITSNRCMMIIPR